MCVCVCVCALHYVIFIIEYIKYADAPNASVFNLSRYTPKVLKMNCERMTGTENCESFARSIANTTLSSLEIDRRFHSLYDDLVSKRSHSHFPVSNDDCALLSRTDWKVKTFEIGNPKQTKKKKKKNDEEEDDEPHESEERSLLDSRSEFLEISTDLVRENFGRSKDYAFVAEKCNELNRMKKKMFEDAIERNATERAREVFREHERELELRTAKIERLEIELKTVKKALIDRAKENSYISEIAKKGENGRAALSLRTNSQSPSTAPKTKENDDDDDDDNGTKNDEILFLRRELRKLRQQIETCERKHGDLLRREKRVTLLERTNERTNKRLEFLETERLKLLSAAKTNETITALLQTRLRKSENKTFLATEKLLSFTNRSR